MEIISQTPEKVSFINQFGLDLVKKKTSIYEAQQLIKIRNLLQGKEFICGRKCYTIKVPRIRDYCAPFLYMEKCFGENLEIMLRSSTCRNERVEGIEFINNLLQFFINKKIFWHDFAPRNILINKVKKIIYIFDMERGVSHNMTREEYLRNFVFEEYAAFLLPKERIYHASDFLGKTEKQKKILSDDIKSKRIRTILKYIAPNRKLLDFGTCEKALMMILKAEEPYVKNGIYNYPIVDLEKLKDKSYDAYAQKVIEVNAKNLMIWKQSLRKHYE